MVKLWFRMVPNNHSRAGNMKEKNRKTIISSNKNFTDSQNYALSGDMRIFAEKREELVKSDFLKLSPPNDRACEIFQF